jgi:hypothetical protein
MALRLYRTTRQLYDQVTRPFQALQVPTAVGGNPTRVGLIALYVTGLLLRDARPSQTRISQVLPARAHDALNRLLRPEPLSTRALLAGLVGLAGGLRRARGTAGYLVVDDVVLEKAFAKRLPWAAWTYSFAKKHNGYGCHIVLLSWTSDPSGRWRSPGAFRLWRPKRTCRPGRYQQKTALVVTMLRQLVAAGRPAAYLVGDTAYTGGAISKTAARVGLVWVGTLQPRTQVIYRGQRQAVRHRARQLKLQWRPQLGVRAVALRVYAPALGQVRLGVLRHEHGNYESLVTNALATDLSTRVARQRSRWRSETIIRDTKQLAGLEACQCWGDQAFVRPVALVVVAFVVLQLLRRAPQETVGAVKARWQGEVLRDGQAPPPPWRAAPPEFRPKRTA